MEHGFTGSGRPAAAQRRLESSEDGLAQYMLRVYNYMAAGLMLTGAIAYVGAASGLYASIAATPLFWVVLLAPLALVVLLSLRIERISLGAARAGFWTYAALIGLSLSGIFLVYTGDSIARVFFISAATFGATSLYGYTTRADLSRLGSFLFMALAGIVIARLVNLFLASRFPCAGQRRRSRVRRPLQCPGRPVRRMPAARRPKTTLPRPRPDATGVGGQPASHRTTPRRHARH